MPIRPPAFIPRCLLLGVLCYFLFFYRSGVLPFVGADEPRYARISQEMLQTGDWVIPHLEGKPWFEKPPLYYWATALAFAAFGVGEAQARLTSALSMLGMVLAVYVYGRRWFSERAGWWGSITLACSLAAIAFGRAASMDALFSFMIFGGLCAWMDALLVARRFRTLEMLLASAVLGGAVLAKGVLGLLLPAGILVVFLVWTESWGRIPKLWFLAAPLAAIAVALPWHLLAFQRAGFGFVSVYLVNHHIARFFTELHHHAQPVYYYAAVLIAGCLPWTFAIPGFAAYFWNLRRPDQRTTGPLREALFLLALLTAVTVAFFSLSASKLPGYILPCFPAISLLLGCALDERAKADDGLPVMPKFLPWVLAFTLVMLGAAAPVFLVRRYDLSLSAGLVLGGVLWLGALGAALARSRPWRRVDACVWSVALAMTVFIALLTHLALDRVGLVHSTREAAGEAVSLMQPGDALSSYRFFHQTLGYYSGYTYRGNIERSADLKKELTERSPGNLYLVTEPRYVDEVETAAEEIDGHVEALHRFGPRVLLRLTPRKALK